MEVLVCPLKAPPHQVGEVLLVLLPHHQVGEMLVLPHHQVGDVLVLPHHQVVSRVECQVEVLLVPPLKAHQGEVLVPHQFQI